MRLLDAASPITYEVTVHDAGLPGLPSPSSVANSTAKPASTERAEGGDATQPDAAEDDTPQRDVVMHEARRILADYVALLRHGAGTTIVRSLSPTPPDR